MARNVKCAITGEMGTNETFVKINGKYYKSQAVYDQHLKDKEYLEKTKMIILDCMGWQEGEPFPLLLTKKLKEFSFYPAQTLYNTVKECENSIRWYMQHKDFKDTTGRIFYICAIISNKIGDVYRTTKTEDKQIYNDNIITNRYEISEIISKPQVKDLSMWLEDGDEL